MLLSLAAFCLPAFANVPRTPLVAEKPHLGGAEFALAFHQGPAPANALTAPGIGGCLYDSGRRSRSTGKERDAETGLDLFSGPEVDPITKNESVMLRYYSGAQGRFTSPDKPFLDQDPGDPQSWNLFGFVRNNPLSFFDLSGGKCKKTKDGFEGDCASPGDEKVTEGDKAQQADVRLSIT